jgi:ASC-1-like (ASCH) protein
VKLASTTGVKSAAESNMKKKVVQLRFRVVNRGIFDAIKSGDKKVETRAATIKFRGLKSNDKIILVCGKQKLEKIIKSAKIFKNIKELLKKYKPRQINPKISTAKDLEKMYYSFPGYKEKILKNGIIALELK